MAGILSTFPLSVSTSCTSSGRKAGRKARFLMMLDEMAGYYHILTMISSAMREIIGVTEMGRKSSNEVEVETSSTGVSNVVFHSLIHSLTHSFIHPLIHSFIHSLIHSFIHLLTHSFIYSFIHSFTHSFIHSLTHSSTHSFIYSLTHSFIHSFADSFIYLFIHLFTHSFIHSFIHSLIHLLTHLFIHLFIHSFIHSLIYSLTQSFIYSFIHSFTHSFIHLFIYSFTHAFILSVIHFIHSFSHLLVHSFTHSFIDNPQSGIVYNFGRVCLSVCKTIPFESPDIGNPFSLIQYISREYRTSSHMKVIGSKSTVMGVKNTLPPYSSSCDWSPAPTVFFSRSLFHVFLDHTLSLWVFSMHCSATLVLTLNTGCFLSSWKSFVAYCTMRSPSSWYAQFVCWLFCMVSMPQILNSWQVCIFKWSCECQCQILSKTLK